ncbi:uncharacterized protein BHQ10_009999 [Talaromyces amestolkiae]|uniref:Lipase B n=1 Tax=Talaromyces amestolkiae TaxID=1196081 RepID=A0A364LDW4_TALAM|nr:uncharacterized protein BHQ10_009999 [Talaromyces amestolkiae]RAO73987.1 hypothetical protein BHQ10_009999 [Talaromyces amestolkiae]
MRLILSVVTSLVACAVAKPVSVGTDDPIEHDSSHHHVARSGISGLLSTASKNLTSSNPYLSQQAASINSKVESLLSFSNNESTKSSSTESAADIISAIFSTRPADLTISVDLLLSTGLLTGEILNLLNGFTDSTLNSISNNNALDPETTIYPSKSTDDAPYSVDEHTLRSAIYIPDSFSYGANGKIPILLVPGTFIPAGVTYYFSFSKLGDRANVDPVWVNVPGDSLGDAQINAEFVAYAINYISGISSSSKIGVISWSQGGLDTQWALKYWPSTRSVVQDFIPISPDFHGTDLAYFICPGFPLLTCTPSVVQQEYTSSFVATLRAEDGDSAFVPTTVLYSSFDEIVEPQGGMSASAYMLDVRDVGVTNAWTQEVCAGQVAGGVYTHEGMLYNPLSWALAIDALTHDGPGDISRLDLDTVCSTYLAEGLLLDDLLGTEGLLLLALVNLLGYESWTAVEPPIMAYA